MRTVLLSKLAIALWLFSILLQDANASPAMETWYLPQDLSDKNTVITFDVDSTWHMVHGKTAGVSGFIRLSSAPDASRIDMSVELPVARFDTNDSGRDEELRSIFSADTVPTVTFLVQGAQLSCTPRAVQETGSCKDSVRGKLRIRTTEKEVELPITVESSVQGFRVSGEIPLLWEEYGIEDPSIFLIAKVDPVVVVRFNVNLGPEYSGNS